MIPDRSFRPPSLYAGDLHYGADDNRFTEELQRLLGHAWEHAAKIP